MAFFQGNIRSKVLAMDTAVNIVIPYDSFDSQGKNSPYTKTLILLHGLKQNASAWSRMSSCESFANTYGYNLIIPEVQRSFYSDMAYGLPYFTYISQELPEVISQLFRIPMDNDHLYAGGLSMGGFGALKCALTYPQNYKGVMCFSSGFYAFELDDETTNELYPGEELKGILGESLNFSSENDLEHLAKACFSTGHMPSVYISCGTEDFLYHNNLKMKDYLTSLSFPLLFEQWQGGHTWTFWNQSLERAMRYFNHLPLSPVK